MANITNTEKKLLNLVETVRNELIELTVALVRIKSQNIPPQGQEAAAQKFIKDWLSDIDIKADLVDLTKVEGLSEHELFFEGQGYERREYEARPNLAARISGANSGKTLILSGHIDTMPAGKTKWQHEPFGGDVIGNKLYGRGAFDMKGGITAELMALKILKQSNVKLSGDIIFESVVDEEHAGCNGTLANRLAGYNGDAVIIPEPSNMQIYNAHKGFRIVHLTLKGKSGMSFAGEELVNPVEYIGLLIDGFKTFRQQRRQTAPKISEYRHDKDPVPVLMNKLQAGEFSLDVPMQIPEECKLEVYWQTMPGETRENIEKEFFEFLNRLIKEQPELKQFDIEHHFSHRWMPAALFDRKGHLFKVVESAVSEVVGRSITSTGAPFPCDLFIFDHFGIPGAIIGPCGANCHGSDEYVEIDSLMHLTKILLLTIVRFSGLA